MRDLHDPNNPDYEKESELTRELIFEKLTDEEICFLEEEDEYLTRKSSECLKRIGKIKNELKELIEFAEQSQNTYLLMKLNKIVNL